MAKGAYIGVDGKARKIKKGYIGVDGKARKIKKAYIGIGGVARPCWSGGTLVKYGEITPLSLARRYLVAASNKNYAMFACGSTDNYGSINQTVMDAYDKSLTRTVSDLGETTSGQTISNLGNYSLFNTGSSGLTAVDGSLTLTAVTPLSVNRSPATATIGDYGLFVGGGTSKETGRAVDAYDTSLTSRTLSSLSGNSERHAGASVGDYAIFSGVACAYNKSLGRTYITISGNAKKAVQAASNGKYVVFYGGLNSTQTSAFDASLTETILNVALDAHELASCEVEGYAIFSGGQNDGKWQTAVRAFDQSLTRLSFSLAEGTAQHASTSIGDYGLVGGGNGVNTGHLATVTAFTVA